MFEILGYAILFAPRSRKPTPVKNYLGMFCSKPSRLFYNTLSCYLPQTCQKQVCTKHTNVLITARVCQFGPCVTVLHDVRISNDCQDTKNILFIYCQFAHKYRNLFFTLIDKIYNCNQRCSKPQPFPYSKCTRVDCFLTLEKSGYLL